MLTHSIWMTVTGLSMPSIVPRTVTPTAAKFIVSGKPAPEHQINLTLNIVPAGIAHLEGLDVTISIIARLGRKFRLGDPFHIRAVKENLSVGTEHGIFNIGFSLCVYA